MQVQQAPAKLVVRPGAAQILCRAQHQGTQGFRAHVAAGISLSVELLQQQCACRGGWRGIGGATGVCPAAAVSRIASGRGRVDARTPCHDLGLEATVIGRAPVAVRRHGLVRIHSAHSHHVFGSAGPCHQVVPPFGGVAVGLLFIACCHKGLVVRQRADHLVPGTGFAVVGAELPYGDGVVVGIAIRMVGHQQTADGHAGRIHLCGVIVRVPVARGGAVGNASGAGAIAAESGLADDGAGHMRGMVAGRIGGAAELVGLDVDLASQQFVRGSGHARFPHPDDHVLARDVHTQAATGVQRIGPDQLARFHIAAHLQSGAFAFDVDGLAICTDALDAVHHTIAHHFARNIWICGQVAGHGSFLCLKALLQLGGQVGVRNCRGLGWGRWGRTQYGGGQRDGGQRTSNCWPRGEFIMLWRAVVLHGVGSCSSSDGSDTMAHRKTSNGWALKA